MCGRSMWRWFLQIWPSSLVWGKSCLHSCWMSSFLLPNPEEALFLPLVPLLKWCQLKEVPVKGARCFCLLLGFNSSFSSLEAHDSYAKSRDILILYLLGKTDALIPLSLLADEPSRWEPHFQIVLQQKWHSLDFMFSNSAPSDLNPSSAVLYSQGIFLNAKSPIAVIRITNKLGTYI